MKRTLAFFLILATFFINFSCITKDDDTPTNGIDLCIGDHIPPFSIIMNNGKIISNKSLEGEISIIVFFNTKCKDCQKELPVIQRFYENHPNIPIICISRAQDKKSIAFYWQANQLTLPYSAQENRDIFELFAYHTIPRIYIIDENGIIQYIFTDNPLAQYEDLTQTILKIQ